MAGGTILAASEGSHSLTDVEITVVVTLVLYWIAHAYAEVVGNAGSVTLSWNLVTRELAAESPILFACIVPLVVLVVVDDLGASFELAVTAGLCVTVGLLFVWGVTAALRAGLSAVWALTSGLVLTALGVAIVVLKLILAH